MKKLSLLLFIFCVSTLKLQAQVGGISASKLATICCQTVPLKSIEFEPAIGFNYSSQYWNNKRVLKTIYNTSDSVNINSELAFRFTYGLFKNFEIGLRTAFDLSLISWGIKYNFKLSPFSRIAFVFGSNIPAGNGTFVKGSNEIENITSLAGGIVYSTKLYPKLAFDFDMQMQKYIRTSSIQHKADYFINNDWGYWVTDELQLVAGVNYANSFFEDETKNIMLLTFNPGITIETASNFLIVLNVPFDILGKNADKTVGLGMALTIMID